MQKRLVFSLALMSLAFSAPCVYAKEVPDRGSKLYMSHCSKCHSNGQNDIRPSKPIVGSSVLATFATFKAYLDKPVGTMPHYSDLITDQSAMKDLYRYVKNLDEAASSEPEEDKEKGKDERSGGSAKKESSTGIGGNSTAQEKVLKELNKNISDKKEIKETSSSKSKDKKRGFFGWWPFK